MHTIKQLNQKSIEELKAIANKLKVTSRVEEKQEWINAIIWGQKWEKKANSTRKRTKEENAVAMTDSIIATNIEKIASRWSLKALKLFSLEKSIAPIKGHKGHKNTWIKALMDAGVF
jgi:hypothetical protein